MKTSTIFLPLFHLASSVTRCCDRIFIALLIFAATVANADWPNTNATKWVQYPNATFLGLDVVMVSPLILADDFPCTNTGPITDIHLWTSWKDDPMPQAVPFVLSIWSDVPVSATNKFSHPGDLLWQQTFLPGQYQYRVWTNADERVWIPEPWPMGQMIGADSNIWQYNFYPTNPFVQEGTPAAPKIYWLSVTVPAPGLPLPIGWKSSTNLWNDDAVFGHVDPQGNPIGDWQEMLDPNDTNISLSLSFAITTSNAPPPTMDFGDAPDPAYPTLLASNGARHTVNPAIRLGAMIDAEANGQPNTTATGDDLANVQDEDGVVFNTPLVPGQMATVTVTASIAQVPLNAWVDFGSDGSWLTPGDQIFNNAILAAGPNVLMFAVPANAVVTNSTFARFRFSTMGNLAPTGPAPNGEVEDYQVQITPEMDFGDAPDQPYPTLLANNGARHIIVPGIFLGQVIDSEFDGQPNATATGDDVAGPANDEDGVAFVGTLIPGQTYPVNVSASANGFLNAWVDFNGDGSWATVGDQVFSNQVVSAGINTLSFPVPQTATWGATAFARFRFDTTGGLSYNGQANDGEVEDYAMTVEPMPMHDLGDAPSRFNNFAGAPMLAYPSGVLASFPTVQLLPIPLRPSGPIHMLPTAVGFLGGNVTFESNADLGADQDFVNNILPLLNTADLDGADDGVAFPLTLPHCRQTQLIFTITFPGPPPIPAPQAMFVNVWLDWNRDGDWNDTMTCPDGVAAPEWAVQNMPIPVPIPPQFYPIVMPLGTPQFRAWHPNLTNDPVWMRISIAEQMWPAGLINPQGGEGPVNGYLYGETEDFYITNYNGQVVLDWGDAPSTYPTLAAANGATHQAVPGFLLGAAIDTEADGQPVVLAVGDDNNGVPNDEDGIVFSTALVRGSNALINVTLASGPAGGFLDGWVDFNKNGTWDASEQVFTNQALASGANPGLGFLVPTNAVLGTNYARFRLSSLGNLAPTGAWRDGEVEDYFVVLSQRRPLTNVMFTSITVTNITSTQQAVTLQWNAEAGIEYQLQSSTNLAASPIVWADTGPLIPGPQNTFSDTNSILTQIYYRIKVPFAWP